MVAPVLIFAIGNESRGDDALGPMLLRKLEAWINSEEKSCLQKAGRAVPVASATPGEQREGFAKQFELMEDFQLQIEHTLDMQNRSLVLFIDAGMDTPSPYAFYRAQLSKEALLYSHALPPEALLKVYEQFYRQPAPDAYVLCIRGEQFELGELPSPPAETHLASALEFAGQLLLEAKVTAWDRLCTQKSPVTSIRSAHETSNIVR